MSQSPNNVPNYFQHGMDIDTSDISDTENINRNLTCEMIDEDVEQEEVGFVIDRTPSPPNQNEEYEENIDYDSDATEDDGLDEDYDVVRNLLDNIRHNEENGNDDGMVGLVDDEDDDYNDENEYIGLACIANVIEFKATQYNHIGYTEQALEKYLFAISLSPYLNCYNDIGTIYESMGNIEKAKHYYLIGIEYTDCILSMYNIADLFRRDMNNSDDKTKAEHSTRMMLKYYSMAANKGDNEAVEMICALAYGKDPVMFSTAFKQVMEHRDDHYCWDGEYDDDEDKAIYGNFMRNTSTIEILQMLQSTDTEHMNESEKKQINDCIGLLNKETSVTVYNNKISLFKRLNHVVECGICYDEKLNIDLHCGHCVCTDCYVRLYTKSCPFCRIDTPYGFFE